MTAAHHGWGGGRSVFDLLSLSPVDVCSIAQGVIVSTLMCEIVTKFTLFLKNGLFMRFVAGGPSLLMRAPARIPHQWCACQEFW